MGHLTLIAEEANKFQKDVQTFGTTPRDEQTRQLMKEEAESNTVFYLKTSVFIFTDLYTRLFETDRFIEWNGFLETKLKEVNSMYNKVLGNPNEIPLGNDQISVTPEQVAAATAEVAEDPALSSAPMNRNVIILDNGDSEDFRRSIDEDEIEEDEEPLDPSSGEISAYELDGGDLRPMKHHESEEPTDPLSEADLQDPLGNQANELLQQQFEQQQLTEAQEQGQVDSQEHAMSEQQQEQLQQRQRDQQEEAAEVGELIDSDEGDIKRGRKK
ncbi:unnamed protein product [Ambrosiozyma monospora]|uniref:Unnamed protein product n=1 Tax=Ambrosiozyma monospora TaxID=43982 RepID=A0ACB5SWN1_AMBMO|nr:unnamed protein product [Ambrosiozyma monospora]